MTQLTITILCGTRIGDHQIFWSRQLIAGYNVMSADVTVLQLECRYVYFVGK